VAATETLPALRESATAIDSPRLQQLSGTRKAAVLLAALGLERAATLIQLLGNEEIESVTREMAQLTTVGPDTTVQIFSEMVAQLSRGGSGDVLAGVEYTYEVVERALGPERAAELLGGLSSSRAGRPFEFLRQVPADRVAGLLRGEAPQAKALVIANLTHGMAAEVLSHMPKAEQPDIAQRIVRMETTSTDVIEAVESAIRGKLREEPEHEFATVGGAKALAGILNHADRSVERTVLEKLGETDRELADEVRALLFVFEDIAKLEERAIQQVLREVDQKDLVTALRGAQQDVADILLANMSERGAAMLKEEMEVAPPQKKREVDAAQTRIVGVVRKLEEAGTIVIRKAGGDDDDEDGDGGEEADDEEESEGAADA
jgi:flagellar motor switch protein FliG